MDGQSFYFQTIAQKFFELRGAPFFLSSNELTLIEKWEAAGIPLRVVLEGIFCDSFVKQSFALYKERSVGRKPPQPLKMDKKKDIRAGITKFLDQVPRQVVWLESPFKHVKEILTDVNCPEEDLEKAEEHIEALLVAHASPEDHEEAKKEAEISFPEAEKENFQRIFQVTLIKHMRSKYKIPHVAPFLY